MLSEHNVLRHLKMLYNLHFILNTLELCFFGIPKLKEVYLYM